MKISRLVPAGDEGDDSPQMWSDEKFLHDHVPAQEADFLEPAVFFFEDYPPAGAFWPGVHNPYTDWQGWARPLFSARVRDLILESMGHTILGTMDSEFLTQPSGGQQYWSPRSHGLWGLGAGTLTWLYDDMADFVAERLVDRSARVMDVAMGQARSQLRSVMATHPFAIGEGEVRDEFLSLDFVPTQAHIDEVLFRTVPLTILAKGKEWPF
jgi:hypothetical protein